MYEEDVRKAVETAASLIEAVNHINTVCDYVGIYVCPGSLVWPRAPNVLLRHQSSPIEVGWGILRFHAGDVGSNPTRGIRGVEEATPLTKCLPQ